MLNVYFGITLPDELEKSFIYDTSTYFKNVYKDQWITDELSKQMIKAIDQSTVISAKMIDSPFLGSIGPTQLSGGVKTLILINKDDSHIYNASNCGNNCAKWLLRIAEKKKVVVNLRHIMDFGEGEFKIRVMNQNKIVKNMKELLLIAGEYV